MNDVLIIIPTYNEKENIDKYKLEAETAEREGNYGRVAEIRYGKIKEQENLIISLRQEMKI